MKLLRSRLPLLWLCSLGFGACVSTTLPQTTPTSPKPAGASTSAEAKSQTAVTPLEQAAQIAAPVVEPEPSTDEVVAKATRRPPTPLAPPPPPPVRERLDWSEWVERYKAMGQSILNAGRSIRYRQRKVRQQCLSSKASSATCRYHRRSAKIFSINYRTSPRNYRGYVTFYRKRKKLVPRPLMKWLRSVDRQRYFPRGRCHIDKGMLANCMTFALCSVKDGMRNYKADDQGGFDYPTWGIVQYWTTKTFYAHMHDYVKNGQSRMGIRTMQMYMDDWSLEQKLQYSRQLLSDMYSYYKRIVKRKSIASNHDIYNKAFCSNMVIDMGRLSRALPGDVFGKVHYYKRKKNSKIKLHFQHWGLIADPEEDRVFHIQTPGGLWGKAYTKWGIQYGSYDSAETKWKWLRKRRRYRKTVLAVHRINLHYYMQARQAKVNLYTSEHPNFCQRWIDNYADIYFTNMASPEDDD